MLLGLIILACTLCAGFGYASYIDWPSFNEPRSVRNYLPDEYPVNDAHHYTYSNFMDTWELYRFTTTPEAVAFLAAELSLESKGTVNNFPLIISKPPPYWWDPELLDNAELFRANQRAADGHIYEILYSRDTGIVYLIRFDG